MTTPDPDASYQTKDGVEIPLGKGINISKQTSLLYNEYPFYSIIFLLCTVCFQLLIMVFVGAISWFLNPTS